MSDNVDMTPEARWRHLRENGTRSLVNLQTNELIEDKPEWFNEERFKKSREILLKYLVGVLYSSFTGLLLILQLPDGLEPLLSTGNSKDIPSLFKRYLSTIVHVTSWYDDDVFNPETKGYKSIRQVRAMHKRVQSLMNDKFKVNDKDGKPRIWMSQYDVAMTQFAFIGLGMIYPKKAALIGATNEDLEHINYYWRVLGHLMGVADEFNACQFEKYEDIREFNRLIFEHEYKDNFKKSPCKKGLEMTQSICLALHYFMPLITFNQLAHWWKDCFLFNGYEPQPMTKREKVLDFWTSLSFNHLLKYEGFLSFSTKLHRRRFERRLQNKDKVYEKLKAQYKDNTQHTYYSDRIDYFAKKDDAMMIGDSEDPIVKLEHEKCVKEIAECNNNDELEQCPTSKHQTSHGCPLGYGLPVVSTLNGNNQQVASG